MNFLSRKAATGSGGTVSRMIPDVIIFLIIFLIAFIQALIDVVRNTTKIKKWKKLHQTFDVGNIKKKFSLFQFSFQKHLASHQFVY